jgi:hypothetical protein
MHQQHVYAVDYRRLEARQLQSNESFAIVLRGFFYCMQASQPNLPAMRAGLLVLVDGQGVGWQNFSLKFEERAASLYVHAYPARIQRFVTMHVNLLLRLFWNLLKPLLSRTIRQRHVFCGARDEYLQTQGYPLEALPTAWGGTLAPEDLMPTWSAKLTERYALAESFSLEE